MNIELKKLSNGQEIPVIGVGTGTIKYRAKNKYMFLKIWIKEQLKNILIKDFKKNNKYTIARDTKKDKTIPVILDRYFHEYNNCLIDTARAYQYSENVLGNIIKKTPNTKRFIMSKMTNTCQREGKYKECVLESLKEVGVDCLDIYMLHWPQSNTYIQSYKALLSLRDEGYIKGVGVANFNIEHLKELQKNGLELPVVNEFECHPYLQQRELVNWCKKNKIQVIAYAPTGHKINEFSKLPRIKEICIKYGISPSQMIMRWHYQNGIIPIFNTTNYNHLKENMNIFTFNLTLEEMAYIDSLDSHERYWPDPANCDFTKL